MGQLSLRDIHEDTWGVEEKEEARELTGPILIIGASGFIGARLTASLKQVRNDVLEYSRRQGNDVTNLPQLEEFIEKIKPQTIFNVSSYGGHGHQKGMQMIHHVNYLGTANILHALRSIEYRAFVQAGSSSEYGLNGNGPHEDAELIPNSEYAVSKIGAFHLVKYYGTVLHYPTMHLRLYTIYGPGRERWRLMPNLVSHCLKGTWPPFVDKTISHDFVYVDDCTNAFVKAALRLSRGVNYGTAVNIATGIKTTMEEVANIAKDVFTMPDLPKFGSMENRSWDIENWYGNPARAHTLLNWHHRTDLATGMRLIAEWEKKNAS